ncbi:MAG: ECF transporter S component [Theionarchaea archaeon]|nr:ECF transporter S component [Theionarchaea archaeon]MBU6999809.1 ECF transporter S component [Theionarchaea archaeon]MBU7020229.1 ECF transporter S component [Theionarchaea archaeon]MBU7033652.1 ECF transporter S component [Theionarchaea archaeon]MBU7040091.1 ECF transporter S component [Theionarchaea archaeon]
MKYYFQTKDLVKIAILSALGGVSSTYIGYLGNLVNRFLGVPFGAGQFLAGLHIFWVILAFGLVKKEGTCTMVGILKGLVELFTGGKLGIFVILLSGIQGVLADVMFLVLRKKNVYTYSIAGGIATAANVFIFQLFFAPYNAIHFFTLIALISFVSGVAFAGVFAYNVLNVVEGREQEYNVRKALTLVICAAFMVGGVYYYSFVYKTSEKIEVTGDVGQAYFLIYDDFSQYETTVEAEMVGQYKYEPEAQYTGIPLSLVVERANPRGRTVRVIAEDGYAVDFPLDGIEELILTRERRLIAKGYEGSYWVQDVIKIEIL